MFSRLRILAGVAVVLALVVAGKLVLFGDDETPHAQDPNFARIEKLRRDKDVSALAKEASGADVEVCRRAVGALGRVGRESLPTLERALRDGRAAVRERAATSFSQVAGPQDAAPLAEMAREDESADVRAAAVSGLYHMRAFEQMESLLAAMDDPDVVVRRRAATAAVRIIGIGVGYKADDPPAKRRADIQEMRAVWLEQEARVRRYWTAVRRMQEAKRDKAKR